MKKYGMHAILQGLCDLGIAGNCLGAAESPISTLPPYPMKRHLKYIAPLSLGKILGILFACLGLLFLPFFLLFALIAPHLPHPAGNSGMRGLPLVVGVGMALMIPIFYGVLGFLQGVIGAAIYNLLARWVGGIEVEVE